MPTPVSLMFVEWPGDPAHQAYSRQLGWTTVGGVLRRVATHPTQLLELCGAMAATLHLAPLLNEQQGQEAKDLLTCLTKHAGAYVRDAREADGNPYQVQPPILIADRAARALSAWNVACKAR